VSKEARLPGLATWGRVRDWRMTSLRQAANVELYLDSPLTAGDVLSYGIRHVAIATGARWRTDAVGRVHRAPLPFLANGAVVGVDALLDQGVAALPDAGPVVVFDDDRYYMASVLAEMIALSGRKVTFVTPASIVAPWTDHTLEQRRVQTRLIELGIDILLLHQLADFRPGVLNVECTYSGKRREIDCSTVVPVTARLPVDGLWRDLFACAEAWADHGIETVERIGDCLAPGIIAAANYAGHFYARKLAGTEAENFDAYR
jgi:dimethylamine/trimethylamine dehydrogenase